METVDIITLVAIILFARLGIRLYYKYRKLKDEQRDENERE
jgi:hypothetical protein